MCKLSFTDKLKTKGGLKLRKLKGCVAGEPAGPGRKSPPHLRLITFLCGGKSTPHHQSLLFRIGVHRALLTGDVVSGLDTGALKVEAFWETTPFFSAAAPVDERSK